MKRVRQYIFLAAYLFLANLLTADPGIEKKNSGDLKLIIVGLKNNNGKVKIALHNQKETYLSRKKNNPAFKTAKLAIKNRHAECVFSDIPFGEYAVTLYHDENGNDDFDTNFLGLPKEAYGFSNNVRGRFKAPSYRKVKFVFSDNEMVMKIIVK